MVESRVVTLPSNLPALIRVSLEEFEEELIMSRLGISLQLDDPAALLLS